MDQKTELEKEERTIFIVLAIIVMIAIGVLVIWYFTKDKALEDNNDSDNKTKTVDKQKKKDTESDTQSVVQDTKVYSDNKKEVVTVISSKVNDAPLVKVEEVSPIIEDTNNQEEIIKNVVDYNLNSKFYIVGETINFNLANIEDPATGNIVNLTNAKISSVLSYDSTTLEFVEAIGKYSLTDNQNITFIEEGEYIVKLVDLNNITYSYKISILNKNSFSLVYQSYITLGDDYFATQDIKYFDQNLWQEALTALNKVCENEANSDLTFKRELLEKFAKALEDLANSKDEEALVEDAKVTLDQIVIEAEALNKDEYTIDSYAKLKELLDQVEQVKASNKLEEIQKLTLAIKEAMNNLILNSTTEDEVSVPEEEIENQAEVNPTLESEEIKLDEQVKVDSTNLSIDLQEVTNDVIEQ